MSKRRRLSDQLRASEAEIAAFTLRLDKFLGRSLRPLMKRIEDKKVSAEEAAALLGGVYTVLENAGLDEEVAKLSTIFASEVSFIREEFGHLGRSEIFSAADRNVVEALVDINLDKTSTYINQYVDNVRSVVMQTVLSGERPDFSDVHDEFGDSLQSRLETELNTGLSAFSRTITIAKGRELGFEKYEYLGPDDDVTRPFCEELLSRSPAIYTLDEISEMDNEQGLDVLIYGGGYNCRHQWRPVGEDDGD